jgi:hypothetical protein
LRRTLLWLELIMTSTDNNKQYVKFLEDRVAKLEEQATMVSWQENPDRMGGQFTKEEINHMLEWEGMGG